MIRVSTGISYVDGYRYQADGRCVGYVDGFRYQVAIICLLRRGNTTRTQLIRGNRTLIKYTLYSVTVQMCPFYAAVRRIFWLQKG